MRNVNVNESQNQQSCQMSVMVSVFESMTNEQLLQEQLSLENEIEAATERLRKVENEIFYRYNPECRQH